MSKNLLEPKDVAAAHDPMTGKRVTKIVKYDVVTHLAVLLDLKKTSTFQNAANLFALRMRTHLILRDSAAAYVDFREGFQAYRALVEEPTVISGLVRINVLATLISGIGEGLTDHAWEETEIRKLDVELMTVRVWENYRLSISSERGTANWVYETYIAAPARNRVLV